MTTSKGDLIICAEYYVDGEIQIPIAVKCKYEEGNAVTLHSKIRIHNGHVSLMTCRDAKRLKHAEFKRVSGLPAEPLVDEIFQNMGSKHKKFPMLIDYVASGLVPIPAKAIKDMLQGNILSFNKCVPIKSNIQVIQTNTPFVILRKHPRFSILQKDENTMNKI